MGQRADEVRPDLATSSDEVEELRAEIEETRAELSDTIDAIQEKLSPDNLKEQVKDKAKEAIASKAQDARSMATQKAQQARQVAMEKVQAARPVAEQKVQQARSNIEQKVRGSGTRTVESLKQNPKQFALAGVGLAALTGIALALRSLGRRAVDTSRRRRAS